MSTRVYVSLFVNGVKRALAVYTENRGPCLRRYLSATSHHIISHLEDGSRPQGSLYPSNHIKI